jgi:hypothetical protein
MDDNTQKMLHPFSDLTLYSGKSFIETLKENDINDAILFDRLKV